MSTVDGVERARLECTSGWRQGSLLIVHFNPASLEYTIESTVANKDSGGDGKQHAAQRTGKLSFELVFDTTDTGQDVQHFTRQIASWMEPEKQPESTTPAPPTVAFEWGNYNFEGTLESYRETIDLFSANGVPLRSTLHLSMTRQNKIDESKEQGKDKTAEVSASGGASGVASRGGDPRAARDVATLNGEASLRFSASASVVVGGSISLAPPVAFATGGAGGGIGIGGGIGLSIGGGVSGSVSGGISGGVSFGAGAAVGGGAVFGSRASARVTASAGAFAGLRAPASGRRLTRLRPDLLLPRVETSSLGTDQGASFQPGGRASVQGSASLRADVSGLDKD